MSGRAGVKFFVWGGGRWREVSLCGRVAGWGRAEFVAARGGRLERVRRGAVLRGLRALAAGRPRAVRDGPPLSQIRLNDPDVKRWREEEEERSGCERCCRHRRPALAAAHLTKIDTVFDRLLKTTVSASTQCSAVDAATQVSAGEGAPLPAQREPPAHSPLKEHINQKNRSKRQEHPSLNHASNMKRKRSKSPKASEPTAKRTRISPPPEDEGPCKELIIEEEDVVLLRTFIERSSRLPFEMNLQRFDEDDSYKQRVFFRLNPIVNLERSRRIERMLREQRSRSQEVSLKDFASVLGLQSVAERSSQDSGPSRRRTLRKRVSKIETSSADLASDTDKENEIDLATRRLTNKRKVLKERVSNDTRKLNGDASEMEKRAMKADIVNGKGSTLQRSSRSLASAGDAGKGGAHAALPRVKASFGVKDAARAKDTGKTVTGAGDAGRGVTGARDAGREVTGQREAGKAAAGAGEAKKSSNKKVSKPVTTNQGNSREYSALEDAAIVRWVRVAGRARRVNGNRLWRELQPLHHAATGHFRSWHSLRNRYLRSLLPRLAALLPAHHAARLRADAATGELKARKLSRRSVSPAPRVQSAWSRRPRPPPTPPTPSPSPSTVPSRVRSPSRPSSSNSSLTNTTRSSDATPPTRQLRSKTESPMKQGSLKSRPTARLLRSSGVTASPARPAGPARVLRGTHTPTYSELTKRFAGRSPAGSGDSGDELDTPLLARRGRRLYNPKDAL